MSVIFSAEKRRNKSSRWVVCVCKAVRFAFRTCQCDMCVWHFDNALGEFVWRKALMPFLFSKLSCALPLLMYACIDDGLCRRRHPHRVDTGAARRSSVHL